MSKPLLVAASVIGLGALVAVGLWQMNSPKNGYECMLNEMRGQPETMKVFAANVCAARFPKDF